LTLDPGGTLSVSAAAQAAAERAARHAYGRLLAILVARNRDVAAAEDALATALARALEAWPAKGIPDNPDGWLLTVARNSLLNRVRHRRVEAGAVDELLRQIDERTEHGAQPSDERIALLFVCAHPAIDPAARAPMMLQTVLGIDAARIAAAFVVPPATMSQRLVRAKARIKAAGLRFAVPEIEQRPERLADVLEAIYGAFSLGWDDGPSAGGLPEEAIELARLVAAELPGEPEARGLLALMLHAHARRKARRDAGGRFVPLADQDTRLWDRDLIVEAEGFLIEAARAGRFGRFQCEAAIQSVHAQRGITGQTNFMALDALYRLLVGFHPTAGAITGHAAVQRQMGDAQSALATLDQLDPLLVERYQPAMVLRTLCLKDSGDTEAAAAMRVRALALTQDPVLRAHLETLLA